MSSIADDQGLNKDQEAAERNAFFERLRAEPFGVGGQRNGTDSDRADVTEDEPNSERPPILVEYAPGNPFIAVRLAHPFRIDGKLISSLRLRPPRYDAVLAVLSGNMRHTEMFAEMADVDESIVIALRWPDAAEVIRTCHFLAPDLSVA